MGDNSSRYPRLGKALQSHRAPPRRHLTSSTSWKCQVALTCCPISEDHNSVGVVPLLAVSHFPPLLTPASLSCPPQSIRRITMKCPNVLKNISPLCLLHHKLFSTLSFGAQVCSSYIARTSFQKKKFSTLYSLEVCAKTKTFNCSTHATGHVETITHLKAADLILDLT